MKQDFKLMQEMVDRLQSTNSSNDKEEILADYTDSEFISKALFYTKSPYKQYGVTGKNIRKMAPKLTATMSYDNVFTLLDALDNRDITGHTAISAVLGFLQANSDYEDLIYGIIDDKLNTRTGTTQINKVFVDLIPTFEVALAAKYEPRFCDFETERWFASRKLDGVRSVIFTGPNNDPKAFSRAGKPFETVQKVLDEIKALNMPNMVFDGEICLIKEDGSDDFQGIMKVIKKKEFQIENPRFKIFDLITQEDFDREYSTTILSERLEFLEGFSVEITESDTLAILEQEHCSSQEIFNKWSDWVTEHNWEGFMLRKDTTYEGGRSKSLLKVKTMHDAEYIAEGITPGMVRHIVYNEVLEKNEEITSEMLSNVYITHKGNRVDVGSGFTIAQRQAFFADPSLIVGKTITVQFFEETTDKHGNHSLRFPVLKHVFENGRNV